VELGFIQLALLQTWIFQKRFLKKKKNVYFVEKWDNVAHVLTLTSQRDMGR
jgi:hypothetical protein